MKIILLLIDAILTLSVGAVFFLWVLIYYIFSRKAKFSARRMFAFEMSYTLEAIRKRKLEVQYTSRDIGGYFEKVCHIHPLATINAPEALKYGKPSITPIHERHFFIEGKIGQFKFLKLFNLFNYLVAQFYLYLLLRQLIKTERISVIWTGDPLYLGMFGLVLARTTGLPVLVQANANNDKIFENTGHPMMPRLFHRRWIEKIIERYVFKHADIVAGGNLDNLNFCLNNGARRDYSTVLPITNSIHYTHFMMPDERANQNHILGELRLLRKSFALFIGRLEGSKFPEHFLMVLAEIKKMGHTLPGLFIGDGRMKRDLLKMATEFGMANEIVFAGERDQEWIASVIPCAKVFIAPLSGRALLEASLGALPIIAYDVDWHSVLVKTGKTGELVEYRDWKAMAESTMKYLKDPEYAELMGRNIRKAALGMMDSVKLSQHERNEYDKLFARYFSE
ncbi:MAG: glycosyltransferase family 4 protein [Proteobacteria bacterium]|nr:glycosyltransferase family 4 protein [Pseudomonadota bacterium]